MTFGGVVLIALIAAVVPVWIKLREHSRKLKELDEGTIKLAEKK